VVKKPVIRERDRKRKKETPDIHRRPKEKNPSIGKKQKIEPTHTRLNLTTGSKDKLKLAGLET
jgi:hypothetical protein